MNLYNLRSASPGYRINKFDMDTNWLASYDLRVEGQRLLCTCPASTRPTCKHRKILGIMKAHVDDGWFYCYESQKWHRPIEEPELQKIDDEVQAAEHEFRPEQPTAVVAQHITRR